MLPILILIHGTGDVSSPFRESSRSQMFAASASNDAGTTERRRWWEAGSGFLTALRLRIRGPAGEDLDDLVLRFIWSGQNSERDRSQAALELAKLIRSQAGRRRPVYILAHSHGGNVAKAALERLSRGFGQHDKTVRAVICIATPFFHRSTVRHLVFQSCSAAIALAGFVGGVILANKPSLLSWPPAFVLIFASVFVFFSSASRAWGAARQMVAKIFRRERNTRWLNFYARRDEAMLLLSSFNRDLRFMPRRPDFRRMVQSPLGFALALTVCSAGIFAATFATSSTIFAVSQDSISGVLASIVAGAVTVAGLGVTVWLATMAVTWAFAHSVDAAVSSRLRTLAFGLDDGSGLIAAHPFPWPGFEASSVVLPDALETALDQHVTRHTGELWTALRRGIDPGQSLLHQDLRTLVGDTLTWNELAHTSYFQIEGLAQLVADTLAECGDWVLCSPARAGPASPPVAS